MKITMQLLVSTLCVVASIACLAQASLPCPEIQYEEAAIERTSVTVDRLEGQVVFSLPELPRVLGNAGGFCIVLFSEGPVRRIASTSTHPQGAFEFGHVAKGDYVLLGRHSSGEGETVRLPIHVSGGENRGPTRGLLLRVNAKGSGQGGTGQVIANLELRQVLLDRFKTDQAIRMEMIDKGSANVSPDIQERMSRIDAETDAILSAIIREHGWPGLDKVGLDGTTAASGMLQHLSAETKKKTLPLVEAGFRAGNVMGQNYAMLVDTVRLGEGRSQLYGTSAKPFEAEGQIVFQPIEDEAGVDARRAEMGLPPLEEYRKLLREIYFPKKPAQTTAPAQAGSQTQR